jgi:hypothetical protein
MGTYIRYREAILPSLQHVFQGCINPPRKSNTMASEYLPIESRYEPLEFAPDIVEDPVAEESTAYGSRASQHPPVPNTSEQIPRIDAAELDNQDPSSSSASLLHVSTDRRPNKNIGESDTSLGLDGTLSEDAVSTTDNPTSPTQVFSEDVFANVRHHRERSAYLRRIAIFWYV